MQLKNPLLFPIIIIILFCLLLTVQIYKNLTRSAGAISLKSEEISQSANQDFYIVSVIAENLKVPFFGTAFHVNYNPQNYVYDHFTLGNYFEAQDDPMVLVNANTGGQNPAVNITNLQSETVLPEAKIIVGISLKRGQLLTKPNGTLLKLYFKKISDKNIFLNFTGNQNQSNPLNEFSFSNAVFSSFDTKNAERKDIQNITFKP